MDKLLFIDRDGTLLLEPENFQVDHIDKFRFYPGVIQSLAKIAAGLNYKLVMVTNQDGLGTASYPEKDFWPLQELMIRTFEGEGIYFDDIHIDRSFAEDGSPYRKPGTAMLRKYLGGRYDLGGSFVIGDRWSDIQLAANLGTKSILIQHGEDIDHNPSGLKPELFARKWKEIEDYLFQLERTSRIIRATSETHIEGFLNLDGTGKASIKTGIGFFDHMLEQIAKHSGMDLTIEARGDLHIDEHHTIEDSAIVLGQLMHKALGKKAGIGRYGFALPMDETGAQVLLDFGGRPWLVWDVELKRERIGDMPVEMFHHFFKTFSDHAHCNVHIMTYGENEHHMIEGIFKSFAKAIQMAKNRTKNDLSIPSTKGIL